MYILLGEIDMQVLVIEDNDEYRHLLGKMYESLGASVMLAECVSTAESFLKNKNNRNKIDIVSLDLNLGYKPGEEMTSLDLAENYIFNSKYHEAVGLIVFSGYSHDLDFPKYLKDGEVVEEGSTQALLIQNT